LGGHPETRGEKRKETGQFCAVRGMRKVSEGEKDREGRAGENMQEANRLGLVQAEMVPGC
jgi:hypothetical protein